jgi:probable Rubsico expression protein CbbX
MMTRRTYYSGLGVLLLIVALTLAWLLLNLVVFTTIAASIFFFAVMYFVGRDGWRQTSPANLESRGIYADDSSVPITDPGLRRDYAPMLPFSLGPRTSIPRAKRRAAPPARRPSPALAAAGMRPALGALSARTVGDGRTGRSGRSGRSNRRSEALRPDASVTFADERREANVDDLFAALDSELIGLAPVKKKVAEIGSLLLVDRARQRFGLSASRPNLHMCFTGSPGTGKTTVALMMADLLHRLGYLEQGQLVHAMRDDLVGQYIGQTAPRTRSVLTRAAGGVLFIDEAYSLYRPGDSRDYGQECIDILMQVMENDRDKLVVILAGYKDRMDVFFESYPGMGSRIAHHLDFAPYETDELLAIGRLMLDRSSYYLSPAALEAFRAYLSREMTQSQFANARSVRNALEGARLRHAYRLSSEPDRAWTKDDLMRLEPTDIFNLD